MSLRNQSNSCTYPDQGSLSTKIIWIVVIKPRWLSIRGKEHRAEKRHERGSRALATTMPHKIVQLIKLRSLRSFQLKAARLTFWPYRGIVRDSSRRESSKNLFPICINEEFPSFVLSLDGERLFPNVGFQRLVV